MAWSDDMIGLIRRRDFGPALRIGIGEVLTSANVCQGYLTEMGASLEAVDGRRTMRALTSGTPHFVNANLALILSATVVSRVRGEEFTTYTVDGDEIVQLVALNRKIRGVDGTNMHFVRAAQADALQAQKMFHWVTIKHNESETPHGWKAFEGAIIHAALELDSVLMTFRILDHLLSALNSK